MILYPAVSVNVANCKFPSARKKGIQDLKSDHDKVIFLEIKLLQQAHEFSFPIPFPLTIYALSNVSRTPGTLGQRIVCEPIVGVST